MPLIRKPAAPTSPGEAPPPVRVEGDADARFAAARALGERPEGAAALVEALAAEQDPRVLEAIAASLARIGTPEAVAGLVQAVGAEDAAARTAVMDALRARPEALRPQLASMLSAPDPDVRVLACELARAAPGPETTALLAARLDAEPLANVCGAAVETLAEIGDESALPALGRCAARFAAEPFLAFAVRETMRRLDGHRPEAP